MLWKRTTITVVVADCISRDGSNNVVCPSALLQCDLDLPQQEVRSNSLSFDDLAKILLYPIKWGSSNASGFLRLVQKCGSFCLGLLEPLLSGCFLVECSLNSASCTSPWLAQVRLLQALSLRVVVHFTVPSLESPKTPLVPETGWAGSALWKGCLRLDWVLCGSPYMFL